VSQSSALTKAKALKAVMLDYGVPEVSIELQTGRPNPYDSWDGLFVVIDMSHHIVSNYNPSNLTPLLWLVKQGRTSVPGPLANGYGGWDLCYRILCFSYANHPGAGGPMTVPRAGGGTYTIPKDSARRYAWGTEYEGGVVEADWDRLLRNPRNGRRMTMREFMGRAGAAIHDHFNIHGGAHAEHSTWAPDRKIDRLRYDKNEGAAEERRYADAPPPPPPLDLLRKATDMILVKQAKTDPAVIWLLTGTNKRHVFDLAMFQKLKAAGVPYEEVELTTEELQWFQTDMTPVMLSDGRSYPVGKEIRSTWPPPA
jgi:hypothetical protein